MRGSEKQAVIFIAVILAAYMLYKIFSKKTSTAAAVQASADQAFDELTTIY